MKMFRLFSMFALLLSTATLFTACQDDDLPDDPFDELRLDGANQSAPVLEAGTRALAVQFYESDLEQFNGRTLQRVRIFIGDSPDRLRLSVHRGGDFEPGDEISALTVTGSYNTRSFNDYELITPITIDDSQPLWIVAEVELSAATSQPIGCDSPGQGIEGGQWMRYENEWETFLDRGGENVNWNIRGLVD